MQGKKLNAYTSLNVIDFDESTRSYGFKKLSSHDLASTWGCES